MNLETFDSVLSKVCGFATLVAADTPPPTPLPAASPVIRRVCGQILAKVRVSRHRTVVILLVYNGERTHDLEVM